MIIIGGFLGLATCVAASVIDIREYRIPNRLVAFGFGVMLIALVVTSVVDGSWNPLLAGFAGGSAFFMAYLVLALISPTGMGMGDVKLAAIVGLMLGPLGLGASVVGFYAAFVAGALFGLMRMAFQAGGLRSRLPFAPFMALGAAVGLVWPMIIG